MMVSGKAMPDVPFLYPDPNGIIPNHVEPSSETPTVAGLPVSRPSAALGAGLLVALVAGLTTPTLQAQSVYSHSTGHAKAGRVLDRDYYRRPYPELVRPLEGGFAFLVVDEQEPNDGFMTAPVIALGDTVTGFIGQAGDVDYFAVDVPAATRLDLRVTAFTVGSSLDGRIDLYDTDGQTLLDFSEDVIGLDPRLVFEVQISGRYYVRVSDQNGTGGGNHAYELRLGIIEKGPGDPTMLWTTGLGGPLGIAAGPAGAFYVVDNTNVRVLRVDGTTGLSSQLASLVSTGLGSNVDVVRDVAVDAFGDILAVGIRDVFQPLVWRIGTDGTVTDFWVPNNLDARFTTITVAPNGAIWLGDEGLRGLAELAPFGDPKRDPLSFVPLGAATGDIFDVAFSPAGALHWSNGFGEIYRLDGGGTVALVAQTEPFLEGLAFDRDGYLYAGNGGIGKVLLFDPTGVLVNDPFAGTNLAGPLDLVFGRDADGSTTSRLLAVNFGVGLPPPFAGGMVEMNPGAIRAPGWPVADFLVVVPAVPRGEFGANFLATLGLVSGETATWSVVEGALPVGLEIDPTTGDMSGRPEELGEVTASVRAATAGRIGFKRLRFQIDPPNVVSSAVADVLLGGPTNLSPELTAALDLLGNRNAVLDVGDLRAQMRALGDLPGQRPPVRADRRGP